jgi:hypothetical protein
VPRPPASAVPARAPDLSDPSPPTHGENGQPPGAPASEAPAAARPTYGQNGHPAASPPTHGQDGQPSAAPPERPVAAPPPNRRQNGHLPAVTAQPALPGRAPSDGAPPSGDRNGQCTAPQLRRFIKSRPYVPMHELRRRFGIDGGDDDVTPVRLDPGWVYVGLPNREGSLLGDLLRAGEIGYELSLDPRTPIVIGVYPMRPIPRG